MDNRNSKNLPINSIEVSGVIVTSQNSSLKDIEKTINRLLKNHKDFLLLKKELKIKTSTHFD